MKYTAVFITALQGKKLILAIRRGLVLGTAAWAILIFDTAKYTKKDWMGTTFPPKRLPFQGTPQWWAPFPCDNGKSARGVALQAIGIVMRRPVLARHYSLYEGRQGVLPLVRPHGAGYPLTPVSGP